MSEVLDFQPAALRTPSEPLSVEVEDEAPASTHLATVLTRTLSERGLDRMSASGIESCLCTAALTAHI